MKTWLYSWRSKRNRGFQLAGSRSLYIGQFESDGYWEIQFQNWRGYGPTIHDAFTDLRKQFTN